MANDRPIVVEMSQLRAPRETADNADKRDREWWAQCSPEELQHEASMMPLGELQATVGDPSVVRPADTSRDGRQEGK